MTPSLGQEKTAEGKIALIPKLSIYRYIPKQDDVESALGLQERNNNDKNSWTNFTGGVNGRHTSS